MDNNMEKLAFGFGFGFNRKSRRFMPKYASDIVEESFDKVASDNNKDNSDTAKRVGLGVAGTTAMGSSKNMIIGKKRMYHGTSKQNWEKIKTEGLRADKGGTGGASYTVGSDNFIQNSRNKVHATRSKRLANFYSNMNEVDSPLNFKLGRLQQKARDELNEFKAKHGDNIKKEFTGGFKRKSKNGKIIKINMDYDKYRSMEIDPDQAGAATKNKVGNIIKRNIASRGNINVTPEEISGSSAKLKDKVKHTAKALPKYIKNNPVRFGTGVALASGGAYALGKAIKGRDKEAFDVVESAFEKIATTNRGLTDDERKELNKNVRGAEQSLRHRRYNTKSQFKNNLAGLGGAAIGAGLGYGAYKGLVKSTTLKSAMKASKINKELSKRKVFDSIDQYKKMNSMATKLNNQAIFDKRLANEVAKKGGLHLVLTGSGMTAGGITGNILRDRSEVKNFMKERYGDDYKPTIRQNEKQKILNRA